MGGRANTSASKTCSLCSPESSKSSSTAELVQERVSTETATNNGNSEMSKNADEAYSVSDIKELKSLIETLCSKISSLEKIVINQSEEIAKLKEKSVRSKSLCVERATQTNGCDSRPTYSEALRSPPPYPERSSTLSTTEGVVEQKNSSKGGKMQKKFKVSQGLRQMTYIPIVT